MKSLQDRLAGALAATAAGEEDVLQWMEREVSALGFARVLVAVLPAAGSPLDTALIHTNYPAEWRRRYDEGRLAAVDPTVGHCLRRRAPLQWDAHTFVGAPQRDLYEEASGHGLRSGVTLPLHDPLGAAGMLTCVAPDDSSRSSRLIAARLPYLALLRDLGFDALSVLRAERAAAEAPKLSARERECLQWHAAGKTSWEIGRILNVTEACVNFHFNNIRSKFNVSHRHEAVLKALTMGILSI